MKRKLPKLPKTIFVRWEDYPNSDPALIADTTAQDHAELHTNRIVGEYRLVEVLEVRGEVKQTILVGAKKGGAS